MQAWGSRSRFDDRDTNTTPTKSGVTGLLCCAMGWGRDSDSERLDRFDRLTFGARVDAPGRVMADYQTAREVITAGVWGKATVQSQRHYLADARFLVGFCGGDDQLCFLRELANTLRNPRWPLFLGRKSFPLTLPPYLPAPELSLREGVGLRDTLDAAPFYLWQERQGTTKRLRLILDAAESVKANDMGDAGPTVADRPLSFNPADRRYAPRRIVEDQTRPLTGVPHPCLPEWRTRRSSAVAGAGTDGAAAGKAREETTEPIDYFAEGS
jgi:CRISPR system Cascade subunit CasD